MAGKKRGLWEIRMKNLDKNVPSFSNSYSWKNGLKQIILALCTYFLFKTWCKIKNLCCNWVALAPGPVLAFGAAPGTVGGRVFAILLPGRTNSHTASSERPSSLPGAWGAGQTSLRAVPGPISLSSPHHPSVMGLRLRELRPVLPAVGWVRAWRRRKRNSYDQVDTCQDAAMADGKSQCPVIQDTVWTVSIFRRTQNCSPKITKLNEISNKVCLFHPERTWFILSYFPMVCVAKSSESEPSKLPPSIKWSLSLKSTH